MSVKPSFLPLIPVLPQERLMMADGSMHPAWQAYHSQLNTVLQTILSKEGFLVPQQTADNIGALDPSDPNKFGAQIYDKTNNLPKINVGGVFKTIMTS